MIFLVILNIQKRVEAETEKDSWEEWTQAKAFRGSTKPSSRFSRGGGEFEANRIY